MALELLTLVRAAGGLLSVGGDAALATEIGADGLHLGATQVEALPKTRDDAGSSRLVGVSAHSLAEARRAREAGADYVTLSPVFPTASKPGYGPELGLAALDAAVGLGIPAMALGGIDPDRAVRCVEAGAAGVAVMGAVMRAPDPAVATRRFVSTLGGAT